MELSTAQVRDILRAMHESNGTGNPVAMDACYSGSIGEACIGILEYCS